VRIPKKLWIAQEHYVENSSNGFHKNRSSNNDSNVEIHVRLSAKHGFHFIYSHEVHICSKTLRGEWLYSILHKYGKEYSKYG
jgi:hypothetical protein